MQVLILGRAPRTKETLPYFLKWRRATRPPLVFRGLTGSQRTPGFWGVTFRAYHPPTFTGGKDSMVVDHWFMQNEKVLEAMEITSDATRIRLAVF